MPKLAFTMALIIAHGYSSALICVAWLPQSWKILKSPRNQLFRTSPLVLFVEKCLVCRNEILKFFIKIKFCFFKVLIVPHAVTFLLIVIDCDLSLPYKKLHARPGK